jgi:hypothetical protein
MPAAAEVEVQTGHHSFGLRQARSAGSLDRAFGHRMARAARFFCPMIHHRVIHLRAVHSRHLRVVHP